MHPLVAPVFQAAVALAALGVLEWILRRWADAIPAGRKVIRLLQAITLFLLGLGIVDRLTRLRPWEVLELVRMALTLELANVGGTPLTAMTVLTVLLVLGGSWWASMAVRRAVEGVMLRREIGDPGTAAAVSRLVQYVVLGTGVAVGLNTLGLNLSAVFAAGAVFAVGIGLAMQQVAENFVSGVILLVERTIRPGDILELDGKIVRVKNLGIRSTIARTLDDEDIIIPNSKLAQNEVKNLRLTDSLLRVRVAVGVAYDSDLRVVMKALERAGRAVNSVQSRVASVALLQFGASSVDFEVSVWTADPWSKLRVTSDLSLAIWDALHEDDVVIAFPQLDVHLKGVAKAG